VNRRPYFLILLASTLMLSSCAAMNHTGGPLPGFEPSPGIAQVDGLLKYYEDVRKLSPAEAAKRYERASQAFVHNKSPYARLQLVMLLSLPNTGFHDDEAALGLLREGEKEQKASSPELHRFSMLLAAMLTTQKQLGASVEEASAKLKEEQNRADDLQNKLNAIKTMEKNLIQRDRR
jgi:hypothetical protein